MLHRTSLPGFNFNCGGTSQHKILLSLARSTINAFKNWPRCDGVHNQGVENIQEGLKKHNTGRFIPEAGELDGQRNAWECPPQLVQGAENTEGAEGRGAPWLQRQML